uniref:Uncharacterized protein n=1 Tax=Micrurus lemniscatus lemniscatus TaxID=129467 RepID=A0A2D4IS35_MICLE
MGFPSIRAICNPINDMHLFISCHYFFHNSKQQTYPTHFHPIFPTTTLCSTMVKLKSDPIEGSAGKSFLYYYQEMIQTSPYGPQDTSYFRPYGTSSPLRFGRPPPCQLSKRPLKPGCSDRPEAVDPN